MIVFGLTNLKYRKLTFILYSLVSISSVPSRLIKYDSTLLEVLEYVGVGILITSITLPMLWIISSLNQRFQLGQKSIYIPFGMVAIVGAARGEILVQIIRKLELEDNLNRLFATISSIIFTSIYFIVISSFLEMVLQKREKFDRIFSEASLRLAKSGGKIDEELDPESLYLKTIKEVKLSLSKVDFENIDQSSKSLLEASYVIQKQINEVLRPLSHRLWVNALGKIKHRNLLGIVRDAISQLDFNVKYILIYQFFVGGYGIALVLGISTSLYLSIIGLSTSILIILIFNFLRRQKNFNRFAVGTSFLISIGLFPVFIPLAIPNALTDETSIGAGLLISPTIPGLILMVSIYRLVTRDGELAIGAATAVSFQVAAIPADLDNSRDGLKLAEYFHNSLQTELFGLAKRLENASENQNEREKIEILDSLNNSLNRSFSDIKSDNWSGVQRIKLLSSSWQGIAKIEVDGFEFLERDEALARRASRVVEELVTNSVRYGHANLIHVAFSEGGEGCILELRHNGDGALQPNTGLGSIWLANNTSQELEIKKNANGTLLKVILAS